MFSSKKGKEISPAKANTPAKDKTPPGQKVKPSYTRPVGLGDSPAEFYKWFKGEFLFQ